MWCGVVGERWLPTLVNRKGGWGVKSAWQFEIGLWGGCVGVDAEERREVLVG